MRWVVMGAGATGGYIGAGLARAGRDITLVARGAHLAALRAGGSIAVHSTRDGDYTVPVAATDDPATITGPVDVVLFAVKAYDSAGALDQIAPLVGPDTAVLGIQNGVESEAQLVARFGVERVLGGAARMEVTLAAPGVVGHYSPFSRLDFGPWSGQPGPRDQAILDDLLAAGLTARLFDHGAVPVWEKFLFLGPMAAVTTATGTDIGAVLAIDQSRELLRQAVGEVEAVAGARALPLPTTAAAEAWAFLNSVPKTMRVSMQRDRDAGRRFELETLCGAVVRQGRQYGVPTPVFDVLYAALLPSARAAEAS